MNSSTMLDTADFVSSEELRIKELPIEARHSICLEISKKRRQSVATSIFIPKELSNHIRFLKKNQRRDANKKTKFKKSIMTEKNSCTTTIAKYKNKYFKRKATTIAHQQKTQQPKSVYIKHPESYPIPNKLTQNYGSERLRSLLGMLREEIAPSKSSNQLEIVEQQNPLVTQQLEMVEQQNPMVMQQLEIVEQEISLGTDQKLTISYAVEVPDNATTITSGVTNVSSDNLNSIGPNLSDSDTAIATPNVKYEVPDSPSECVEKVPLERSFSETATNSYTIPCSEPEHNNTVAYSTPIQESNIVNKDLCQLPKYSSLGNNSKLTDYRALNCFDYQHVKTIPMASTVENFELQLLQSYQRILSHNEFGNNKSNYATLQTPCIPPKVEQQPPQSINFYHHHQQDQTVPDAFRNNVSNCNNPLNFQKPMTPHTVVTKKTVPSSCRHSLHKRHQQYLSYGLQHHRNGLEDPLAAKAWHYTMQKAQARSSRTRCSVNTATQEYSKPITETTQRPPENSWHYALHGGSGFETANAKTHPYNTMSVQTTPTAPLAYAPSTAQSRLPLNYYHNSEESFANPVDLTMYAFTQQSQVPHDPPPPYHHHHQYVHPHSYQHSQHSQSVQQSLHSQHYPQQQSYDFQLQHSTQQPHHQEHFYPQQYLPTHPSVHYVDRITASYPPQIQRLSQAFAHISSAVLPQHVIEPNYWYHLQRDHLYDHRSPTNLHGIVANSPVFGHRGTYINNSLY